MRLNSSQGRGGGARELNQASGCKLHGMRDSLHLYWAPVFSRQASWKVQTLERLATFCKMSFSKFLVWGGQNLNLLYQPVLFFFFFFFSGFKKSCLLLLLWLQRKITRVFPYKLKFTGYFSCFSKWSQLLSHLLKPSIKLYSLLISQNVLRANKMQTEK